jgi:xanthine permease XanP
VIAINLVYPLLVFRVVGAPIDLVTSLLSAGMIVLGVATFLQCSHFDPVGSGFTCPATFTATYLGPSLLAAKLGGLPLVFGMTIFARVLESALAPLLNRLRAIFPSEVSGLVIFIIGLSGSIAGLRTLFGSGAAPVLASEWLVGACTLSTMIVLNVWGNGTARMFCALIGLVVGYLTAGFSGIIGRDVHAAVAASPWIGVPAFSHLSWSFDSEQFSSLMPSRRIIGGRDRSSLRRASMSSISMFASSIKGSRYI